MMLGRSRIAVIAALIAMSAGLMPAHSQTSIEYPSPDHPIDFYRDLASKGAKLAVKDKSAKIEIVQIWPPAPKGVAREMRPYACGYVTPSGYGSRRFIYYFDSDRTVFLASLKDKALIDAMSACGFLPRSPPPAGY
jgi:hypothetical protein